MALKKSGGFQEQYKQTQMAANKIQAAFPMDQFWGHFKPLSPSDRGKMVPQGAPWLFRSSAQGLKRPKLR